LLSIPRLIYNQALLNLSMSDKSVTKTLDWPNHRVGSSPSDPIRFEDEREFNPAISEGFEAMADEDCDLHNKPYKEHSQTELDEDVTEVMPDEKGEVNPMTEPHDIAPYDQNKVVDIVNRIESTQDYETPEDMAVDVQYLIDTGVIYELQGSYQRLAQSMIDAGLCHAQTTMREQQDPSQQLNPTSQQNVTPFSQGQYMPSGSETISPIMPQAPMREEDPSLWVEPCPMCEGTGTNEVSGRPCDYCEGKGKIPKYEEGGDIDDTTLEDVPEDCGPSCCDITDEGGCDCGDCAGCLGDEPKVDWRDLDEELKDPRIGIDKEKGKDKEKSMSPEAQKISGTDPASVEAKEKAKPKLEVDVSDKITVLGKTGSGKTNLIKVLISDILPDFKFVILDALGNLSEYDGQPNMDYHQVTPSDQATVDEVIYNALEAGNCMVVMDEVDRYSAKPDSMLNELVNLGRNYGVGAIFAARRTADVNKDILANSPFIFTFQHILPQDLDVLIDWFAQPEETFRDLQEFEAILFKDGEQVWVGKVPEKPTTKPTAKPRQPKKPKGKDKDKEPEDKEKPKEKEPESKEPEPKEPESKEPEAPPEEKPTEEPPEEEPPEEAPKEPTEEKTEEKERVQWCAGCGGQFESRKDLFTHQRQTGDSGTIEGTAEKAEERPFKCDQCPDAYKYEKDFLNHIVEKHS